MLMLMSIMILILYIYRYSTWKVRLHAVTVVGAIAKCSSKLFFGYWTQFIPSTPHPLSPSLFTLILNDPSPKVRCVGVNTLSTMLDGSKSFLVAAEIGYVFISIYCYLLSNICWVSFLMGLILFYSYESRSKPSSFTPFSHTLGAMVREIHNGLLAEIDIDAYTPAINQTLKVTRFSRSIHNCIYRLSIHLISSLLFFNISSVLLY